MANDIFNILLDFRRTKDWFYSLRWIPPKTLMHVLLQPYTFKQEYVYLTHRKLYPKTSYFNLHLNPQEYRAKYAELLSLAPKSDALQDPIHYLKRGSGYYKDMESKL